MNIAGCQCFSWDYSRAKGMLIPTLTLRENRDREKHTFFAPLLWYAPSFRLCRPS